MSVGTAHLRVNLIYAGYLMASSLAILGTYCHYQGSYGHIYTEDYRQLPLICLGVFYFAFANGPFRITHEMADLIVPKKCDFTIRCLLTTTNWFLVYATTRVLPDLIDVIGVGWMFWFMAIMCLFMTIFVKLFVPDTRQSADELKLCDSGDSNSNSEA